MYAETRAKISCGLVTPHWCWVPFWLLFPCNVFSIWRSKGPHHCRLPHFPLQCPTLLVFAQYELRPWLPPCQLIPNVSTRVWESFSCSQPGCIYQVGLYNNAKWVGIFLGGHHFRLSECNIELDKKKFDNDAMINGTTASWDNRRPFYAVRIGVMSLQSPSKIELQKDTRNGLLITTPPTFEWTQNKNPNISKNSGSIYMEFHFRE